MDYIMRNVLNKNENIDHVTHLTITHRTDCLFFETPIHLKLTTKGRYFFGSVYMYFQMKE